MIKNDNFDKNLFFQKKMMSMQEKNLQIYLMMTALMQKKLILGKLMIILNYYMKKYLIKLRDLL